MTAAMRQSVVRAANFIVNRMVELKFVTRSRRMMDGILLSLLLIARSPRR